MLIIIIASACVAACVGTGVYVSKKHFESNLADASNEGTSTVASDETLTNELNRYELLKRNLIKVKQNVDKLDIPTPTPLADSDDADSSLNKVSAFFEKYSKSVVGTEAFILSILPVSQTGEALCSFAKVAPDLLHDAFSNSVAALKDGATIPGVDSIHDCLCKFCDGMAHTSHQALGNALQHHDYMGALLKPVKSGIMEVTGLHDAAGSITESIHDMGNALGSASELSIDPTDFTDLDFSGHIPVITIAMSSFREYNLLMDNKTNAMTSLKNIGLDAAGAGGGGLVGAKAGAVAGSIFGPLGTLVGGIVGGIGGAMGGRAVTNNIKQQPLRNAIEAYQSNASKMKRDTRWRARRMLDAINEFANEKRVAFKNDKMLHEIPVVESEGIVVGITVIIYQAVTEHIASMKDKVRKLKGSIWYSEAKYKVIVDNYVNRIQALEVQLPQPQSIERNPRLALEALLAMEIPHQKKDAAYQEKYRECSKELHEMNDKNNSSILVWSYMVNGLYQKTMNEIADFSNKRMEAFNQFVKQWKNQITFLENKVKIEKGRLGIK